MKKIMQRVNTFVQQNEIDKWKRQNFHWQSAGVRADKTNRNLRVADFKQRGALGVANHVCGAGIRILPVNDEAG